MRKETTAAEIKEMSYDTRMMRFRQEEQELFSNASGMSTAELSERHRKLVDKWRI